MVERELKLHSSLIQTPRAGYMFHPPSHRSLDQTVGVILKQPSFQATKGLNQPDRADDSERTEGTTTINKIR